MINVDKSCDCFGMLEAVEGCQGKQGGLRLPGREGGEGVVIRSSPSKNSSKLQENGKRLLSLLIFGQGYSIGNISINQGMFE